MFLLNSKRVIFALWERLNSLAHELINNICSQHWFEVRFFVGFKFVTSVEMDAKTWNVHDCIFRIPEITPHGIAFFVLHNNFACKSQISIKPCSPKTTSIGLDVELVVTQLIVNFGVGS